MMCTRCFITHSHRTIPINEWTAFISQYTVFAVTVLLVDCFFQLLLMKDFVLMRVVFTQFNSVKAIDLFLFNMCNGLQLHCCLFYGLVCVSGMGMVCMF